MSPSIQDLKQLTPQQRTLLARRLRAKRQQTTQAEGVVDSIPRRAGGGPVPASFAQRRLWFLEQLAPGLRTHHLGLAVRLRGPLEGAALERSLAALVERHEALRTSFRTVDGEPVQVVVEHLPVALPSEPWEVAGKDREVSENREEGMARKIVHQVFDQAFNLETGPLWRARLVEFGAQDHLFVLVLHHLITDGWSQGVLRRELSQLYAAARHGASSPLTELAVQYADFALWQHRQLRGEMLSRQLDVWRETLRNLPPLQVPADRPRWASPSGQGRRHLLQPSTAVSERLGLFSREHGATPFMVLLAAYGGLLGRACGQSDFAIGSPVANRQRAELEGVVGFFVNMLVLRLDLSGDPSFEELVSRTREVALAAYGAQDIPFERLVEELAPVRELGKSPLFQVSFAVQNTEGVPLQLEALQVEPALGRGEITSRFDLELFAWEDTAGWRFSWIAAADRFDSSTVERLAGHFETLLAAALDRPQVPLSALPVLSAAQRQQAVVEWNDAAAQVPVGSMQQLVEAQVRRTPEAVAVQFEDQSMSYAALWHRVRQLARVLRGLGVGRELVVGLGVERGTEMVVAVLAILEAGGAYLPLDPSLPEERLLFLAQDAAVGVVVTESSLAQQMAAVVEWVRAQGGVRLVVDAPWPVAEGERDGTSTLPGGGDELAYVIYTSGSTGRPKGVAVSHRNGVNLLSAVQCWPGLTAGEVLLAITTLSFDIAVVDLFLPLTVGARLVIAPAGLGADGEALAELVARSAATLLQATPATWRLLLAAGWRGDRGLRKISTGEALPPSLAIDLLAVGGELWDLYGPTETTVWSTGHRVWEVDLAVGTLSIGSPLANTAAHVVDAQLRTVPTGGFGELAIAGQGVSRGYLGLPGLTAERFVPDPFGPRGGRLYRTGDRVRREGRGGLLYLGRFDHQVKVRGHRIELGEIEAVLEEHAAVSQAVVVVRQEGIEDHRLVAYVVPEMAGPSADPSVDPSADLPTAELLAHLARRLPSVMVPTRLVVLPSLPRLASGKVDRRALPVPVEDSLADPDDTPRGPVEEVLQEIWAAVLKLPRVGRMANFFTLGGHSLLATQVISRVRESFEVEVPLAALFTHPTVELLGLEICRRRASGGEPSWSSEIPCPALSPVDRAQQLPLSFAQQRLWFLDALEGGAAYNLSLALHFEGPLEIAALRHGLHSVVARHEALRTCFPAPSGEPRQEIAPLPPLAEFIPLVDLTALPESVRRSAARHLARAAGSRPFDLGRGPVMRSVLLRLAEEEHALLLTIHHIVADGWSLALLEAELAAHYRALVTGEPLTLPPPPVQPADHAVWQRRWLSGAVLNRQLLYWRGQLQGRLEPLELPLDRPRPARRTSRGGRHVLPLPAALTEDLRGFARRRGATLAMVLQAALKALLGRLSGQREVVLGMVIANRTRRELEELIGLFANTLVLRTDLGGDPSFEELVGRERSVALGAYDHQDLPFERLVEDLEVERDVRRNPLFDVLFAFQNQPRAAHLWSGTLRPRQGLGSSITARFDLELYVFEEAAGLVLRWVYNRDLFDATTVRHLARQVEELLAQALAAPAQALSALSLLSVAERHQTQVEWNDTAAPCAAQSISALVAAQVRRTPRAVAVEFFQEITGELVEESQGEVLCYDELWTRVRRLAGALRSLGVGGEKVVGLCVERRPEMVVAVLAILEAGGAYLPLDPSLPQERLLFMMRDAGLTTWVTTSFLVAGMPALKEAAAAVGANQLLLDQPWPLEEVGVAQPLEDVGAAQPLQDVGVEHIGADRLAYVLYTSGSTGRPKAVGVSQRNVLNLLLSLVREGALEAGETMLAITTLAFDIAAVDLFLPLIVGARMQLAPAGVGADGERLAAQLAARGATLLQATPGTWRLLLAAGWRGDHGLRMISTGEALPPSLGLQLVATGGALWNLYGPTETTVWSTGCQLSKAELAAAQVVMGGPLANTSVQVLDAHLQPLPWGGRGELVVGGLGVSRGYLGRPALTAARFVPDPFGPPGHRLYRTGDRVRRDRRGRLVFLGRLDQQVKLRGQRIELGEIEAVLEGHPAVSRAVVVLRTEGTTIEDQRLVAFWVPSAQGPAQNPAQNPRETQVREAQLRSFLLGRIPVYMVPALFEPVETLPTLASGKVDRKALASLRLTAALKVAADSKEPQGPLEEALAELFASILRRVEVGAGDSFFALGGHSLLAMRLVSGLRTKLGVEVPLRWVFEAPTVAELAARIERGGGGSEEAGVAEGAEGAGLATAGPAIVGVTRGGTLPLSLAQERIWFLEKLSAGAALLNMPAAFRLRGRLVPALLHRAFAAVVRRQEALRMVFEEVGGQPVLRILPAVQLPLPTIDLGGLPADRQMPTLEAHQRRHAAAPFDLAQGPLLRGELHRLAAQDHVLLLNVHHLVSDGWSMGLLLRELFAFYQALTNTSTETSTGDRPPPLPELAVHYVDFAAWQRQWLRGGTLAAQLAYWRRQLADPPPPLELPLDRPRGALQSHRGASVVRQLSAAFCARLLDFSGAQGVTLFMTLLTAFKVLLVRWSGQPQVVVGTPIAGRGRSETEPLIGLFLNTLALRTTLGPGTSFEDALRRVREITLGAYSHQDVPFETLLAELNPERDLTRTPFFQVFFNMLEFPQQSKPCPGLEVEMLSFDNLPAKFDLTLYASRRAQGLVLRFAYSADLFEVERMQQMAEQYVALLAQVVDHPRQEIYQVSLVTERMRQVLPQTTDLLGEEFHGAVHDLFAAQARRTPQRVAVIDREGTLTYGELAALTKALAAHLRRAGVGRGDAVVIHAHRSAALPWAILGVLTAGAAFVILEPAHPAARTLATLEQSGAKFWLEIPGSKVPEEVQRAVTDLLGAAQLRLPERHDWKRWLGEQSTSRPVLPVPWPLPWKVDAADLACIGFTSGSTGVPKGICGLHGALTHFLPWQQKTFAFAADDCFSMISGVAHDPLQRDLFTPLTLGATVSIPDPEQMFRPGWLAGWLARERISIAHLTPAHAQFLTEVPNSEHRTQWPALRLAFFIGDILRRHDLIRLQELAPALTCVNLYGSTETQRALSYHLVTHEEQQRRPATEILPLGRGMDDMRLLVLGRGGQPAAVGELGEICIRSPHLARGYLHDPALTARRWTPTPEGGLPGERLYRSGDLGRYLPQGEVVFVGRADQQVKVRGFRIELGEIEAVLAEHPEVAQAVAGVHQEADGSSILVAWVVPVAGAEPTVGMLRELVGHRLPTFMVPAACFMLHVVPRTANGKIDRMALARRAGDLLAAAEPVGRSRTHKGLVPSRNRYELHLLSLFEQVLAKNPIGVEDSFFELGGHSLLATRLFALIEKSFDQTLPISTLFRAPTVAQLAKVLRDEGHSTIWSAVVPIHPWGERPPLFCVHGITGDPFIYRHLAQYLDPDQPLYGLRAQGLDGESPPFVRVEDMAAHYLQEIQRLQPHGPYFLGGFCFGGTVASEIARQFLAQGEEVAILAIFDTQANVTTALPKGVRRRYALGNNLRQVESYFNKTRDLPTHRRLLALTTRTGRILWRILSRLWRPRQVRHQPIIDPSLLAHDHEVTLANRQASRRYTPDFYPGKVTLFRSTESIGPIFLDPRLGWQVLATEGLEILDVPGLHHAMFDKPHVRVLAETLQRTLDAATATRRSSLRTP